jgi:hypothetical protein
MPSVVYKIQILEFKHIAYTKAARRKTEVQFRQAARAFVRAAVPRIPVETGMARGSFLNIGRFLRVAVPIAPTRLNQKYYATGTPIAKTPKSGAALTTFSIPGRKGKKKLEFRFNSQVFHYQIEEHTGLRSPSAPWLSLTYGMDAFNKVMRGLFAKSNYPQIANFVTKTIIR